MNAMPQAPEETGLLRWGGLAGLLGAALMFLVFCFVGAVVGPDPAGLEGPVSRFPQISASRTLENAAYLAVMVLWAVHLVAVARALRSAGLAHALFGGVLGVAGLAILAAGALPHFVASRLADIYHAGGATPADRAMVAVAWQANQGLFDALLATGLILLSIGLVVLGVAMLRAPAFGRAIGRMTVVLGIVAFGAAAAFIVDPRSAIVGAAFLVLIVVHLAVGWRAYRRADARAAASPAPAVHGIAERPVAS